MAVEVNKKVERRIDPDSTRVFAVGDIHGKFESLVDIVGKIESYERAANDFVVFLGDYVDKGPDSKKVLDFLINYQKDDPEHVKLLMGNHDHHFVEFSKKYPTKEWAQPTIKSYILDDKKTTYGINRKEFFKLDSLKIKEHRKFLKENTLSHLS